MASYELTEREREALSKANHLNNILAQSSIASGAESAERRGREQAAAEQQYRKQRAAQNTMEARSTLVQGEGGLDRAAALQRAQVIAGQKADLIKQPAINMIGALETFKTDAQNYQGDELGGVKSYGIEYGPPLVADLLRKTQSADMQGLMSQATALDNQIRELVTSGVLSNMDVKDLKPLSVGGTVSQSQLNIRAKTLQEMIARRNGLNLSDYTEASASGGQGGMTQNDDGTYTMSDGRRIQRKR